MTDTTNTVALRSEAASIIGLLTSEEHQSFTLDKLADFFDDVFRLLEAERQRADDAMTSITDYLSDNIKVKAELAALKGEQVPVAAVELNDNLTVAEIRGDIPRRKAVRELYEGALVVGQELFTAQQKPVVLPEKSINDYNRYWIDYQDTVAAIEAAGGIVKDGE
ncbi:hypothetical protein [Ewingella americana]